jgi:hypothetical protein
VVGEGWFTHGREPSHSHISIEGEIPGHGSPVSYICREAGQDQAVSVVLIVRGVDLSEYVKSVSVITYPDPTEPPPTEPDPEDAADE